MRRLNQKHWPYRVAVTGRDRVDQVLAQMSDGSRTRTWNIVVTVPGADFYFRDHGEAVLFQLRWA